MKLEDVYKIIDKLYSEYKIPEMAITSGEWQAFLDNLNECLTKNKSDELEVAVNILIRRALYYATFDNSDRVTLYHLVKSLSDLVVFNIQQKDIVELGNKIYSDGSKNNAMKANTKVK